MSLHLEREDLPQICRRYMRLGLNRPSLSPFEVYDRIRGTAKSEREAVALLSFHETVRFLRRCGKQDALRMFCSVYMIPCTYGVARLSKNEVSRRVLRCAIAEHCDERTVYRKIRLVRRVYQMILAEYQ